LEYNGANFILNLIIFSINDLNMPLELEYRPAVPITTGVWKITETEEELWDLLPQHAEDKIFVNTVSVYHPQRRIEMLASRALIKKLLGFEHKIIYNGRIPGIANKELYISISHSHEYVAVTISESLEVGVDVQRISDKVKKVAHKFVHTEEWAMIKDENELEYLNLLWAAKECLYKLYKHGDITFNEHLHIQGFDLAKEGKFWATLYTKDNDMLAQMSYHCWDKFVLVYGFFLSKMV